MCQEWGIPQNPPNKNLGDSRKVSFYFYFFFFPPYIKVILGIAIKNKKDVKGMCRKSYKKKKDENHPFRLDCQKKKKSSKKFLQKLDQLFELITL